MNMQRLLVFCCALPLVTARPARSNTLPARVPLPACVETADCIALGKVTAIDDKPVMAPPFPGSTAKIEYRIAVVKVDEGLKGTMGLTHLRVAFQPPPPPTPKPVEMPGVIVVGPPPSPLRKIEVGAEGCFLLKKHGDETFYRLVDANYNDYVAKGDADYAARLTIVRRSLKLLADPDAGLRSKDPADRLLTAYLVLTRYQAHAGPKAKTEPIDAAQSKLVLEAIAGADWAQPETPGNQVTPRGVFMALRLTPKDDWKAPQQGPNQDVRAFMREWDSAAQKWLKDHSATYRIQRWVLEKAEK
jgi:hypothetical protein